jgi:amino acid transporter
MARDGLSFSWWAQVTRGGTPIGAVLFQGACAVVLTLLGTFSGLISLTIFVIWITNALNTVAVFLFRRRYPTAERTYLMPGYPIVPILALLMSVVLLFNMVRESRHQVISAASFIQQGNFIPAVLTLSESPVVVGISVILIGIPVYWGWRRFQGLKNGVQGF